MAKRRSTPPRGVRPLHGAEKKAHQPVPVTVNVPDESERGRPTVPEIDTLAALEAVAAMERARDEMRVRQEVRTRQEIKAFAELSRRSRPSVIPGQPDRQDRPEAVPTPVPAAVPVQVPVQVSGRTSGRVHTHIAGGSYSDRFSGGPRDAIVERVPEAEDLSGRPTLPSSSNLTAASFGLALRAPVPASLPPASGLVVVEPALQRQALVKSSDSPVHAYPQHFGERADPRMIMVREPDSPRAAAFRVLRYRIEQLWPDPLRTSVLAVCAPRPTNGTTTTAVNLALALAECNRSRVCLMEGNMRRPALAHLLGFKPPVCLAERLIRDRSEPLAPWCVAELSASLHVLAVSDNAPRRPLVDGPSFAAGVEAMRRAGYRHVIIDGTEVLGIADMNLIEECVDGVLLVARGGVTTTVDLKVAASQLASRKLIGVMMLDGEE